MREDEKKARKISKRVFPGLRLLEDLSFACKRRVTVGSRAVRRKRNLE